MIQYTEFNQELLLYDIVLFSINNNLKKGIIHEVEEDFILIYEPSNKSYFTIYKNNDKYSCYKIKEKENFLSKIKKLFNVK